MSTSLSTPELFYCGFLDKNKPMSTYENKTNKPTHMNYLLGTRTFGLKLYVSDWALIHITNAEFMKNYQQQETRFCFENLWETSWFEFCTQMSQIWFEIRESHYTVENLSEFFNSPVFSVFDVGACIQFYSSVRNCSFQIPHQIFVRPHTTLQLLKCTVKAFILGW